MAAPQKAACAVKAQREADRNESPRPMTRVLQRHSTDCGVACVAMVAGCTYEEALDALGPWDSRPHYGTETADLKRALAKFGVKTGRRTIPAGRKQIEDLSCDAVLLVNLQKNGGAHWVVWDSTQSTVLDPGNPPYQRLRFCSYLPVYRG